MFTAMGVIFSKVRKDISETDQERKGSQEEVQKIQKEIEDSQKGAEKSQMVDRFSFSSFFHERHYETLEIIL